ncbi:MAG: M48 family metalloprotease [Planctomycetes bacterium]|nr:M48 family metalloprotease [Planctomycetota bacterium]
MNILEMLQSMPIVEAVGWALIHFVWQGALIAVITALVLQALRRRNANTRYLVGCGGMALMIAAPIATMIAVLVTPAPGVAESAAAGAVAALEPAAWDRLTPLLPWFTVIWIVGVLVLQARLIMSWSHVQHLKQLGTKPVAARWQTLLEELCAQMNVRARVRIVESSIARAPMMIGWLEPVILVPTTAFTGLTPAQLRSIIAHELTHVRRHDYLVNLVQAVFETLLFYHPAVWWLSNRIRVEREYCCDDTAVRVCGDALCYAKALSSLDELRDGTFEPALASTGGSLMNRIYRIAGIPVTQRRGISGWPLLVIMSVTAAVSAMAVSATAPEADAAPTVVKPIDRVNIPGILREMGSEDAEMIGLLSEAGLDNRVLMVVLEELGTEGPVVEHIEQAAHRADYIETRMPKVRQHVTQAIAAGTLTIAEAEEKLALARRELMHRYHVEQRPQGDFVFAQVAVEPEERVKLEGMLAEIHELHAAGELDRGEAQAKIEWAHAEHAHRRNGQWVEADVALELHPVVVREHNAELEHHLHAMEDKYARLEADIAEATEAGELTDDLARRKLAEIRAQMDQVREEMVVHRRHNERVHFQHLESAENVWTGSSEPPKPTAHAAPWVPLLPPDLPYLGRNSSIPDGKPAVGAARFPAPRMAPRPALSAEDRLALRKGVAAARDRVHSSVIEGRMTPEQAEKKLAHLHKLEARLSAPRPPRAVAPAPAPMSSPHPASAPSAPLPPAPQTDSGPVAAPLAPSAPAPPRAPAPRD